MQLLPEDFSQLVPLVEEWSLDEEGARWNKRCSATLDELNAYNDQLGPAMEGITAYLAIKPMDNLDEPDRNLLNLSLMYMEVALAIQLYNKPELPGSFPRNRVRVMPVGWPFSAEKNIQRSEP